MYLCDVKRLGHLLKYIVSHKTFNVMKIDFFDIEDLKTMPLRVWSNQLQHTPERMFGNIYFIARSCKFRVSFDCLVDCFYEAKFYHYGSRTSFNKRVSNSFGSLLGFVYYLLSD